MAIENKRLKFILDMVDKVTGPSQKATKSLKGYGEAVTGAQKKLAALNKQAGDLHNLKAMREEATKNTQQSKKMAANIAALTKRIAETKKPTKQMKDELRAAVKEASAHERASQKQAEALKRLESSLTASGVNVNRLATESRRLSSEQARATEEVNRHQRALDAATRKQDQMTQAKERYTKAMRQSDKMMKAGGKVMAGGAALTAGSVFAASPYKDFAAQMSAVQATGGLDDEAKKRLSALARHEAKTSSFGALEAAQAQEYLAMAGFDEKAITASLRGVMDLAVATKTGLGETADIGSNILSGFGLDADQMGRVGDVLTATTTSANTNLSELGETMKYVAGVSKTAGYSLESTAAAAGLMANAGIKGSQSGTALRAAILRMGSLPKAAKKAFADLGVETMDAEGNLRGLEYVLADVAKAMDGMGTGEKIQKLSAMFGAEASAGLAELLSKSSGDEMFAYIKKLENSQGATAKAAAARAANLDGDLKQLYSGIEEVRHKYGESLDLMYRGIVRFTTGVVAKIDEWMAANPRLVKALGLVATALGVIITVSGALLVGLGALWLMMAKLRLTAFLLQWAFKGWMKSILGVIASVALLVAKLALKTAAIALSVTWWVASRSAMLAWVVVCNAVKVAMAALNIVFRLSPLGWLVTAVMALAAAGVWLWKNWDNLPEAFSKLWSDIKGYFSAAWEYIKELLGFDPVEMVSGIWDGLGSYFDGLFGGIWDSFMGTIGKIGDWFKEKGSWALGGFGMFDETTAEAVKEAPKKSPDTGKVETPANLKQGNQIKQAAPVTNIRTTVSPTIHVTAAPGMDTKAIAQEVARQIEAMQRKADQQNRARLMD